MKVLWRLRLRGEGRRRRGALAEEKGRRVDTGGGGGDAHGDEVGGGEWVYSGNESRNRIRSANKIAKPQ
jgi:hypothetical protein